MCISCVGTSAPKRIAFAATCLLLVLPSLAAQTPNFASRRDYYLGGFPQVVALGDFNGDGILDFVTEQERVYFGNGRRHISARADRLGRPADRNSLGRLRRRRQTR